jgi:hypothetical protein
MTILNEKEQAYLDTLKLMFDAAKYDVGTWTIKIDRIHAKPVVLYYAPAQLVKTFDLDTNPTTIMSFALGFAAGNKYGRREATAAKESELRSLLGISVDDEGKLYVSQV